MEKDLQNAFRYHMRNVRPAFYHAQGYNGRNAWPEKANGIAVEALRRAREDVVNGVKRYPQPVRATYRNDSECLRYVGRVKPDFSIYSIWGRNDSGWITDPYGNTFKDGTGLCYGVVYQLTGRRGESRYVAGYQFGGVDGGPDLDLSTIYTTPRGCSYSDGSAQDTRGTRQAARAADSAAKNAAEKEREYQTAWQAGSEWSGVQEQIRETAQRFYLLNHERRAARNSGIGANLRRICETITKELNALWDTRQELMERAKELAEGDDSTLNFWNGDAELRAAFCEGAGIAAYPRM